jgi:hypothetical protein
MEFLTHTHPTQDDMELYAMHRAAEPILDSIEEHLLVCRSCRCELDTVEQQIRVMRIALRGCATASPIQ